MHFKKMIIIQSFNKVFYVYPLLQVSCVNNENILSFKSLWGKKTYTEFIILTSTIFTKQI